MKDISAVEDPLFCWKDHEKSLPILAYFAKRYMCIAASSCNSGRVFSASGITVSPRHILLTEEDMDSPVLPKNLKRDVSDGLIPQDR